ncbi:MAG: hypothetical protein ACTS44_00605 [Candidatus Hodgkinia cicadicola]
MRHVLQFCFNRKLSQIRGSFLKIITPPIEVNLTFTRPLQSADWS